MTKQPASETNELPSVGADLSAEVQPPVARHAPSAAEKLRILQEYDSYPVGSPEYGGLLRHDGICGGLGEYLGIDPTLIRIIFVLLGLPGGAPGIVLYLILWLVMPEG